MMRIWRLARCIGSGWILLAAGCAPAYHDYTGCTVDCRYCPPPPLPYVHYDDCGCHSCAAMKYVGHVPSHSANDESAE